MSLTQYVSGLIFYMILLSLNITTVIYYYYHYYYYMNYS
jgi:hypothetical protein